MWKSYNLRGFCKFFKQQNKAEQCSPQVPTIIKQSSLIKTCDVLSFGDFKSNRGTNDNEEKNEGKKKETCRDSKRIGNLPVSLLESISWMGTALAIGLNLKLARNGNCVVNNNNESRVNSSYYCPFNGQIRDGIHHLLWRIVFAMPSTQINVKKSAVKNKTKIDATSKNSFENVSIPKPLDNENHFNAVSAVDASTKELENVTIEYFSHLETLAGLYAIKKEPLEGFRHFEKGSRLGNPKAHFNLGVCYETGLGTKINLEKAGEHYEIACSIGHNLATYNLGVFYLEGKGNFRQNSEKGINLIKQASEKGVLQAQTFMGIHYAELGEWKLAFTLLEKASAKDPEAQHYLGVCYKNGLGVKKDLKRAKIYFEKAFHFGYSSSDETYILSKISKDVGKENEKNVDKMQNLLNLDSKETLSVYQFGISLYLDNILGPFKKDKYQDIQEEIWINANHSKTLT